MIIILAPTTKLEHAIWSSTIRFITYTNPVTVKFNKMIAIFVIFVKNECHLTFKSHTTGLWHFRVIIILSHFRVIIILSIHVIPIAHHSFKGILEWLSFYLPIADKVIIILAPKTKQEHVIWSSTIRFITYTNPQQLLF